ncbi:MAG: DMT family transporter [Sphingomonadaceae bacterium]
MRAGPILIYVAGVAVFCVMDALMKALVQTNPVVMASFWRYIFALPFIALFWWRDGRPPITAAMLPVHAVRGLFIAASAALFFLSLKLLPLAEAVTVAFVAPLMIPPLAALLLGERLAPASLIAGLVGFAGVLVAAAPADSSGLADRDRLLGVGAALTAALTYAIQIVLLRKRAAADGPSVISLLGAVLPALYLLPLMLMTSAPAALLPAAHDLGLFAAAGLAGAVALQLIARAYARAEAQLLAPFEYTALVWAALIGWVAFAEPVAPRTWAGAAIIALACLWQARRQPVSAPAPATPAA